MFDQHILVCLAMDLKLCFNHFDLFYFIFFTNYDQLHMSKFKLLFLMCNKGRERKVLVNRISYWMTLTQRGALIESGRGEGWFFFLN